MLHILLHIIEASSTAESLHPDRNVGFHDDVLLMLMRFYVLVIGGFEAAAGGKHRWTGFAVLGFFFV